MEDLVRIKMSSASADHVREETLWAKHLGGPLFEVRSLPIFFEGINKMDVVEVGLGEEGDLPRVVGMMQSGGHRTLRVLFRNTTTSSERNEINEQLRQFGVELQEGVAGLWSIDIPQQQVQATVSSYLSAMRKLGRLECETDVGIPALLAQWRQQKDKRQDGTYHSASIDDEKTARHNWFV